MIRFRLKERIADKAFQEGRRITLEEISKATGVNRTSLSKMANQRGYNATTDSLDALCAYFDCQVGDLAEYVPDSDASGEGES
ncbi:MULTISPECIES: helix-turn-helix transcriptional regulator [unclassified Thioalkalivibrio]|uniref:helix-turn-helix domain-containing protein n=1 Tax=unclassified Thioalkalivibrio TaxID=2621013 RepID=UPI00036D4E4E|nr:MULTISPECIES: helix-turn-helix transcriptional regulator [unclassified Thioalkalivibrio]